MKISNSWALPSARAIHNTRYFVPITNATISLAFQATDISTANGTDIPNQFLSTYFVRH